MSTEPNEPPEVHHVYDGIEEQDNRLPNWWLGILFATMVFSVGYWWVYHSTGIAPTPSVEYAQEMRQLEMQRARSGEVSNEKLLELRANAAALDEGAKSFAMVCASCHGAGGQGVVGPNLTDRYWLHGASPLDIHQSIRQGYAEKGMPAWEKTLGAAQVRNLTAYVLTLKDKQLPGKAPEGEEVTQ